MARPKLNSEILLSERLRITAILESPEGIANPKAARELALRSGMEPDSAITILKAIPPESPYLAAMSGEGIGIVPGANMSSAAPGSVEGRKESRLAELTSAASAFGVARGYKRSAPEA